jgi:hypothetical protein
MGVAIGVFWGSLRGTARQMAFMAAGRFRLALDIFAVFERRKTV